MQLPTIPLIALFLHNKSSNRGRFFENIAHEVSTLLSDHVMPSMGLDPKSPKDCKQVTTAKAFWDAVQDERLPESIRETFMGRPFETFELASASYFSVFNWVCQSENTGVNVIPVLGDSIVLMQGKDRGMIDTSSFDKMTGVVNVSCVNS